MQYAHAALFGQSLLCSQCDFVDDYTMTSTHVCSMPMGELWLQLMSAWRIHDIGKLSALLTSVRSPVPLQKVIGVERHRYSKLQQTYEHTVQLVVIWMAMIPMRRYWQ